MPRHVLIVSREDRDLYFYIADRFGGDRTIQVILDRRFDERRKTLIPVAAERRQRRRRLRPEVDEELRLRSHAIVTLTSELDSVREALQWVEQLRTEVGRLQAEVQQYRREQEDIRKVVTRMDEIARSVLSWLRGLST